VGPEDDIWASFFDRVVNKMNISAAMTSTVDPKFGQRPN
jgi:hypothetical protein